MLELGLEAFHKLSAFKHPLTQFVTNLLSFVFNLLPRLY